MVEAFARKVDSEITAVRRTFALRAEEDALEARSRFRSDSSASGGALIVDLREASLSNAGHHLSPAFSAEPTPKLRFDPLIDDPSSLHMPSPLLGVLSLSFGVCFRLLRDRAELRQRVDALGSDARELLEKSSKLS